MPAALARHRWLLLAATLVGALVGFAVSQWGAAQYTAEASLLLAEQRGRYQQQVLQLSVDPNRYVRNVAVAVETPAVAARAAELAGPDFTAADLASGVSATFLAGRDIVAIRAVASEPDRAVTMVNATAAAYGSTTLDRATAVVEAALSDIDAARAAAEARLAELQSGPEPPDSEVEALQAEIAGLEAERAELEASAAQFGDGVREVAEAVGAEEIPRNTLAFTVLAALAGLALAGAVAWWRTETDPPVMRAADVDDVLDAMPLGTLPAPTGREPAAHDDPGSVAAAAHRSVLAALRLAARDEKCRTVLVTAARPTDRTADVAAGLAVAAARAGERVLLIDADVQRRSIAEAAGVAAAGEVAAGWRVAGVDLDVLVVGTAAADGTQHFRSPEFRLALQRVRDDWELALLDCPGIAEEAEPLDLAAEVDGVILVVGEGTPLRLVRSSHRRLALAGSPVLGWVYQRPLRRLPRLGGGRRRRAERKRATA